MIMIKNNRQLEHSKKKLADLKKSLAEISNKYSSDKNKLSFLSKGYKEHIEQLESEISKVAGSSPAVGF